MFCLNSLEMLSLALTVSPIKDDPDLEDLEVLSTVTLIFLHRLMCCSDHGIVFHNTQRYIGNLLFKVLSHPPPAASRVQTPGDHIFIGQAFRPYLCPNVLLAGGGGGGPFLAHGLKEVSRESAVSCSWEDMVVDWCGRWMMPYLLLFC